MKKGKYICLEGGDGTGKSTLAAAVRDRLIALSIGVSTERFPSDGDVGSLIRSGLRGDVRFEEKSYLYLFAADGLNEEAAIQRALANGDHVICDRHPTLSGRVFQHMHHPAEHIEAVYNSAAADGISMPDHLFVLHASVPVSLERMRTRKKYKDVVFEKDSVDELEKIQAQYFDLAERFGGTTVNSERPVDELVQLILDQAGLE